ncbi:MAG: hypothetical protein ACK4FF_03220 [Limnobacter sp.]|uniref:hypothetical protein n=1 Tax=Limnobacter sp. TaxID=2003368 RepID=UPI0039199FD8
MNALRIPGWPIALTTLFCTLLGACSSTGPHTSGIDCTAPLASCHEGRFGLIWKTTQDDGQVQADSISGSYEWRSAQINTPNRGPMEVASLEVNSKLGPSLGQAKRSGDFYEVRAADGRVYLAQDWQTLFDLMFPIKLPANALVDWMKNPNPDTLPPLPANWTWQNLDGRYRVLFVQSNTSGRIDLIPKGKLLR